MSLKRGLNLGCGRKPIDGCLNVDSSPSAIRDLDVNLDVFPWPFANNAFDHIYAYDILEHLDDVSRVMEEIHRVSNHGASIQITTPHYSCSNAFTDPTHRHQFGFYTFQHFVDSGQYKNNSTFLYFYPSLLNKFVWRLANRYPSTYEKRWAWIFPAWYLDLHLEVIKA